VVAQMNARQEFVNLQIDYIEVVLSAAVSRACHADADLAGNPELIQILSQTTMGLCVIYHMAFIQSALGDELWSDIKGFQAAKRDDYEIDWLKFDLLKYIRDCFAHDPKGRLFPETQRNTQRFLASYADYPEMGVIVENNQLMLNNQTVQKSFKYFESFICATIT
jgi:hypothetical protein